jgi:aryl-alcohol dehydrogenase-like predicted oxidoreductase
MKRRSLGSTGLAVSPIGLGLAALGRPAYITTDRARDLGEDRSVDRLRRRCHIVLDAAIGEGIEYVDAARSYGLAESFLASWLAGRDPTASAITVGSKWGYRYVGEWRLEAPVHEVKDHSITMLRRQLEESRALLGSWLRLYQIHSATFESGVLSDQAVLAELARLRDDGLVIGLTVSGPNQADVVRAALDVRLDGVNPFAAVQATWNVLERSVGPALSEAHDAGWGVIVKEALANGRLVHASEPAGAAVRAMAERRGSTADAVALATVLANPWVDVVLSGAVTVEQVRSNVGALAAVLSPGDVAELEGLAERPDTYWAERSRLPWS